MATSRYRQYDPYDTPRDSNKSQQITDSERLDKLEKEVCCLRCDFDKMKYEQAIGEAAIGRAIIRGSASLGGCLISPQEQNGQDNCKNIMENCPIHPSSAMSKSLKAQYGSGKTYASNEPPEKSKKNEREDGGYFTLG